MNEFALIQEFFNRPCHLTSVVKSVGDDCAILNVPVNQQLVVSIDTLVEGVHFLPNVLPSLVAERAVHVAVSDLAAMGASPQWLTLALTLPEANREWLADFSAGLFRAASMYGMDLIGGDTTRGPLTISVQVHGFVEHNTALQRGGAKVNDAIYVTGCLGDGAAGLAVLENRLHVDALSERYLIDRYYKPQAQIVTGQCIRQWASSAIDISDGLLADLNHICSASQVTARIDESLLPYSDALNACVDDQQKMQWALSGGDDYQLCFTVPPQHQPHVNSLIESSQITATCIGDMVQRQSQHYSVLSLCTQTYFDSLTKGYSHF